MSQAVTNLSFFMFVDINNVMSAESNFKYPCKFYTSMIESQRNLNNFQEFSTMAKEHFSKHVLIYKKKSNMTMTTVDLN